jgi:ABC-type dipeptide/oligopeptide/nickel transport system permease component
MRFALRRAALAAALVVGVASASFLLIHLAPGDALAGFGPGVNAEQVRAERHALGLDRPFVVQYVDWLAHAARLDLGTSLVYRRPVTDLLGERAINTAELGATALVLATAIGVPLGVFTGSRRGGLMRRIVRILSMLLVASPPLVGALALTALAARGGWLAPPGSGVRSLLVPALALGLPIAALVERLQSQAMSGVMRERYLTAAVARGLPQRMVIWKHALRASLAPLAAIYGIIAGTLLSGSFIVEIITDWPGLGVLMADGLRSRDLFLVAGCSAVVTFLLACAIFVSDLLQAWIDPRMRE